MRKRWKNMLLACAMAGALVVGVLPSVTYAEEVGGEETAIVSETEESQTAVMDEADASQETASQDTTSQGTTEDLAKAEGTTSFLKDKLKEGSYLNYFGHVQTYGDLTYVSDGDDFGTTGESKRLEALSIFKGSAIQDFDGDIVYRAHVQTYGTQDWKSSGERMGTTGEGKRIEAIQMYLTGELAEYFDIYYCLHAQTFGWTKWVKGSEDDSAWCGTSGLSKRVEAVKICLVAKDGGSIPEDLHGAMVDYTYLTPDSFGSISYSGHQQTYGDIGPVYAGDWLGAIGESKRLEALSINFEQGVLPGYVSYRSHVQTYGWQDWVTDGALSGTTGEAKRLEAVQIQLEGEISSYYDIYYRVHIQSYGWLGWAKNGEEAGSSGLGKRLESIEIRLVRKGQAAPGSTGNSYVTRSAQDQRVLDACNNIYNQVGKDLYSCFAWCVNNIGYSTIGSDPSDGYTMSQWYGLFGLEQGYGDCRTFAGAFYWLAKNLGYSNAHYVYGYVPSARGGMVDHAWVEIDGYVFDPDFQYESGRNGFQFAYGTSGTWVYSSYDYYD